MLLPKIAVTGATGFVGLSLARELALRGYPVIALVRNMSSALSQEIEQRVIGDISELLLDSQKEINKKSYNISIEKAKLLDDIDVVIHCAGRAHIMKDVADNPLAEFRRVNVQGTLNIARLAAQKGIKQFIFISSIKVNGETTDSNIPFSENDECRPRDAYGISKYEAEQGLRNLAKETDMKITIIRPPLIYGPGVKANFAKLIDLVRIGLPLPLGAINNKRSFIALDNLIDFIILCVNNPLSFNELFLISDCEDISTTDLIIKIANAFRKKPILIPVPNGFATYFLSLIGKADISHRLFKSLIIDCSKACNVLKWKPLISIDEELRRMASENSEFF